VSGIDRVIKEKGLHLLALHQSAKRKGKNGGLGDPEINGDM
jgi:hypothetical protein